MKNFVNMGTKVFDFSDERNSVAAFTKNWKSEIHKMRTRIEKERTPAGQDKLAIKTGRGGLMDVGSYCVSLARLGGLEHEGGGVEIGCRGRCGGEFVE